MEAIAIAALVALLCYVTVKAIGATKSVADARIAEAAAQEAQRLAASKLAQIQRIVGALREQIANRDATADRVSQDTVEALGDDPDFADALAAVYRLSGQEADDEAATAAASGPVPTWLSRDPDVPGEAERLDSGGGGQEAGGAAGLADGPVGDLEEPDDA